MWNASSSLRHAGSARVPAIAVLLAVLAGCAGDTEHTAPTTPIIAGPVPFRHHVIDSAPPGGEDCCTDVCAAGDLDGDGFVDLVLGGEHAEGAGLVWYEFPLWDRHEIASGEFTTDMKLGDLDDDGRPDIVVGDTDRGLVWFRNPGPGGGAWDPTVIGPGYVHDVALGDLEPDGDLDIVTCDKKKVVLWVQTGANVWQSRTLLERDGEGTVLADLDRDGDQDVVLGGLWLETPTDPLAGDWPVHAFAPEWPADARVAVGDLDDDGRDDVALSASEGEGRLAWFAAPADPATAGWIEHPVGSRTLTGVHSLRLGDFDGDGRLDLAAAEMHTGGKLILLYLRDAAGGWQEMVLGREGSHNMVAADIGADGDLDLVGKNYAGPGRVFEYWENLRADRLVAAVCVPDSARAWTYLPLDTARDDDQYGVMGLVPVDADRDGRIDIAAGSLLYLNPGGRTGDWPRVTTAAGADVVFATDIDGDDRCDLVAFRGAEALWLEADGPDAATWTSRTVATVPDARTQGYRLAQLVPGGRPELVFTRGLSLFFLQIPADPTAGSWPLTRISDATEEEDVAPGDLDGDGDLDVVTSTRDGFHLRAFLNPGANAADGDWASVPIATSPGRVDRIFLVDLDADGRDDIVVSEESRDWDENAGLAWYRRPDSGLGGAWTRTRLVALRSANSLDVADFDGDGRPDLATAEHTDIEPDVVAPDNRTLVLLNRQDGRAWETVCVDVGPRSSHLGARAVDLDGDGHLDLVSIAWGQYPRLHAWYGPALAGP